MQLHILQPLARFIFGKPERKLLKAFRNTSSPTRDEDTMREIRKLLRKGPPKSQETIDAVNNAMNSLYRFRPTQLLSAATFTLNLMEITSPEWQKCLSGHLQMLRVESSACFSPKATYDFFYNYARTTNNDTSMAAATRLAINTLKTVGRSAPASDVVQAAEDCMHLVLNLESLPHSKHICELASECVFGLSDALAKEVGPAEAAHRIEHATRHHVHSNDPKISEQRKQIVQELLLNCTDLPANELTRKSLLPLAIQYADKTPIGQNILTWATHTVLPCYIHEYGMKDADFHARRLLEKNSLANSPLLKTNRTAILKFFGERLSILAAEAGPEQAMHWALVIGPDTADVIRFTKNHLPVMLYKGVSQAFARLVAPIRNTREFSDFRKFIPEYKGRELDILSPYSSPMAA